MPGGITLSGNHGQLSDTFARYVKWNGRDGAELFVDQSRKFATELYVQTAAIAPTKATIAAKVKSLGWRVIKRGSPDQWLGAAFARKKKAKGRGAGAINDAARAAFTAGKATLAQMHAFVIAKRTAARLYLASGWLGGILDLGGSLKATSGKVDRARGGANIIRSRTGVAVELWNRTPGIETMDAQKHFVAKAVAVRAADMWVYLQRKMGEAYSQLGRAA